MDLAVQKAQRLLRDTIDKRHVEYEQLIKSGSWTETIPKMYVTNAKIIPPTGETIAGHPAAVEYFTKSFAVGTEVKFKTDEVNGDGEWAFDRGTFKATLEGKEVDSGKYVLVWRKIGPDYYIHNDIWNSSK